MIYFIDTLTIKEQGQFRDLTGQPVASIKNSFLCQRRELALEGLGYVSDKDFSEVLKGKPLNPIQAPKTDIPEQQKIFDDAYKEITFLAEEAIKEYYFNIEEQAERSKSKKKIKHQTINFMRAAIRKETNSIIEETGDYNRLLAAFYFIIYRRVDGTATWEQWQEMTMTEINGKATEAENKLNDIDFEEVDEEDKKK